ncbi:ribonuclease inhibitor-like [Dysidea avara]|uniref:ribonuclease inhibitor-like n=1 Tax=Dysidea avara TaxID=196820 RepID=UPI003317CB67
MGQSFSWNIGQYFPWNTDDSRSDQDDKEIDIGTQSANDATRNIQYHSNFFASVLFSCYLYQRNEEKILPAPWPWNIINYFDNKLTSHVGLFESGYSYHYFKIVSTVSELFQFENKWSIVPKTMLIVGSSGIGKTTLCKEIANRWASKEILPNKNCLFLINLDDSTMPKICSLEDLENYSFHPELSNQRAREFLENDNSDIIIIIDGYKDILDHENNTFFTRLIERRILKQCLLIITVHPSALERLQKMVNVSLNVELLGFTEDGINECIQQELQEHPDKIVTLLSYLDDNEYVKGLCYIPTLLMILIQYVKKHKGLSSSFSAMKLAVSHFLHNNSFQKESDSVAQKLAYVIKANVNLEVLRLSCNDFQDLKSSVWFILQALQGISNLKILDMSNNNLFCDGEIVIKDLAGVINNNNCLEELRLSGNRLQLCSSDFVVLRALERICSLKQLNLNCNKISGGTGEHIAHVITNNTCIEELSLSHNYLCSSIVSILRSLSKVSHLRKLNLNCNSISGIEAAEDLATVIANNACLEELCLGNNNFYSSAVVILQALQNIIGLKVLDLSSNNVSENAGKLLANVIKSNIHLKDLRLSFNKLGSSDVVITQALQVISTLRILHLSGNYMSENAGKDLAAAIENNKNIEDLRLSNNNFQESISSILKVLTTTMHLKVLHLSNNSITGSAVITLASVIENNLLLEEVCLPSNGFHLSADKIVLALKKLCKLKKLNLNDNYMSSGISTDLADVIANCKVAENWDCNK